MIKALIGLTLMLAAPLAASQGFSGVIGKFECQGVVHVQACARTLEAALKSDYVHRLSSTRLVIELENGTVRAFEDNHTDGNDFIVHSALEVTQDARFVVLHLGRYEWSEYALLDRVTGAQTRFEGYPAFSPGRRWMAVIAGHEDDQPLFRIYGVEGGSFKLAHEFARSSFRYTRNGLQGTWWPTQFEWVSDSAIRYARAALIGNGVDIELTSASLELAGDVWQ